MSERVKRLQAEYWNAHEEWMRHPKRSEGWARSLEKMKNIQRNLERHQS